MMFDLATEGSTEREAPSAKHSKAKSLWGFPSDPHNRTNKTKLKRVTKLKTIVILYAKSSVASSCAHGPRCELPPRPSPYATFVHSILSQMCHAVCVCAVFIPSFNTKNLEETSSTCHGEKTYFDRKACANTWVFIIIAMPSVCLFNQTVFSTKRQLVCLESFFALNCFLSQVKVVKRQLFPTKRRLLPTGNLATPLYTKHRNGKLK